MSAEATHESAVQGPAAKRAAWQALFVAWLGWMFDGYETYALVLVAGWLITTLGGISNAAAIIGTIYILGLLVVPFAAPETRGQPLPE